MKKTNSLNHGHRFAAVVIRALSSLVEYVVMFVGRKVSLLIYAEELYTCPRIPCVHTCPEFCSMGGCSHPVPRQGEVLANGPEAAKKGSVALTRAR